MSAALIMRNGLDHGTLPPRAGDDATFLSRILRESVQQTGGGPVWVVVDGLDEADPPSPGSNPLLLPSTLPVGVYIVVTRRTGRLLRKPGTHVQRYEVRWDDPLQTADNVGGYLATIDGPRLVALVRERPYTGEPLLERYLNVHRAYGYPQYRNGSLWELLSAVLLHPSQDWVREWLTRVSLVVLAAPNRGEFLESLEIAVLALQANAGDSAAAAELARRRDLAIGQAMTLPPSPLPSGGDVGDVWGIHRRRLAALAEAYKQFPANGSDARISRPGH